VQKRNDNQKRHPASHLLTRWMPLILFTHDQDIDSVSTQQIG
jgi:hypothetical protein